MRTAKTVLLCFAVWATVAGLTTFNLNESQTFSIAEISRIFGMNEKTVRRAIKDGSFPLRTVRIGRQLRVSRVAVERMLAELANPAEREAL